ncbi:Outer membrane protein OmpA [Dyadobacter koreensis]|uniref:Outer membrane protein OmpA n=1 Tax=Dyadobacter koreensis TaxID=408657 RepID=A0A1H6TBA5_9BACT|nr:OmpA family protein [Dyadobacter koreensis]SEI77339.1 Outer membrane protein OmpA [Dyadobacter koreensis]
MAVNLLELTKGYITKEVGLSISILTEESASDVQTALLGALPGLIGGTMNTASTSGGVYELIGLMNLNNENYVLNNLPEILGDPIKSKDFIANGLSMLPMLLDLDLKTVIESIAASSKLKANSVSKILSISAPIVLSVIGKQVKEKSIEPVKLTTLLVGQKEYIIKYLPKDLSTIWDFKGLEDLNKSLQKNPLSEHQLENKPVSGTTKIVYLILALLLVGAAVWGYKKLNKEEETIVVEDFPVDSSGVKGKPSGVAERNPGQLVTKQLPKDIVLEIPENGTEAKLIKFIQDSSVVVDKNYWIDFDRITFEPNLAELDDDSEAQIENIAKIMRAYPMVNIKIGGYTDNTGDATTNLMLSKSRADAVKKGIAKNDIKITRIQSEGYGIEHPIATNDTEEGRTQNRRIAINVTRK